MIRLRANHCAIVPIDDPDKSPGGLWIPDEAKERTDHGIVKYVGPKCEHVQVLDHVIYGGINGQLLILPDEGRLIIMDEEFVAARIGTDYIESIEIPELYYKTKEGYTNATYETALRFLAKTFRNSEAFGNRKNWNVRTVTEKSKPSEFREMKETRE